MSHNHSFSKYFPSELGKKMMAQKHKKKKVDRLSLMLLCNPKKKKVQSNIKLCVNTGSVKRCLEKKITRKRCLEKKITRKRCLQKKITRKRCLQKKITRKRRILATSYQKGRKAKLLDIHKEKIVVSNKRVLVDFISKDDTSKDLILRLKKERHIRKYELMICGGECITRSKVLDVVKAAEKFGTQCPDKILTCLVGNGVPCYGVEFIHTIRQTPTPVIVWFQEIKSLDCGDSSFFKPYAMQRNVYNM